MYDTMIMFKPGELFSIDDLESLARKAVRPVVSVTREGDIICITAGRGSLKIAWESAPHVLQESNEVAERFGIPSRGCHARFSMNGDDPDMSLFNDYLFINEHLQATKKFIIFDAQSCTLLFEEQA